MSEEDTMTKPHVGIGVAKGRLDVWVRETETGESVPHNEAGLEATGGSKLPLAAVNSRLLGRMAAVLRPPVRHLPDTNLRVYLEWLQAELKVLNREFHDRLQDHATWQA